MPTTNSANQFYDKFKFGEKPNKRHIHILKYLNLFGLKPGMKILEIGCGPGLLSNVIAQIIGNNGSLMSIDFSHNRIQQAKLNFAHIPNITFLQADITTHFPQQMFDAIILPDVLEHIPVSHHKILFQQIAKNLNPNGFVMIHIPDPLFLDFIRQNKPDLLQPIDQSLSILHIASMAQMAKLYITSAISYPIWQKNIEYQVFCLQKSEHLFNSFKS